MTLYLASASPRRRQILRRAGISFKVISPTYHEKNHGESPSVLVKKHALGKALSVLKQVKNGRILSADSIVYCRGEILGKPKSKKEAYRMLGLVQGRPQTVFTGVVLLDVCEGKVIKKKIFVERTKVYLKKMGPVEIVNYFKKVNPFDKAGACEIQSKKIKMLEKVEGSLSNAVGLPIEILYPLLKQ